jgi:C-terminal processing protease CtpA/Prc
MFKFTIAKWYTGKTKTSIDHVGIVPDVIKADDPKTPNDELLERALLQ